ncbi:Hypothetical predicted protein [Paramuricea clavata]|uniref:Uncharacterized protein n=1 Tax=Paramuricea clavata TaxID=317549 RepID=A0A6S7LMF9_PARCT|nr:Hypothetical predicted protein [Paramuricea clavata]
MCVAPTSSSATNMGSIIQLLKQKHGGDCTEFKLKVWAKMLSNGTHSNYDMPPKIPFFTGLKAGQERNNSPTSTPAVRAITTATTSSTTTEAITTTVSMPQSMESKARLRSMIIQQLKDLKDLEETGVLDAEEFQAQKKKLANELLSL